MNVAIPIGFLILAIIFLWFFIYTKGKWFIKVGLIALGGFYSLVVMDSLNTYAGWPTSDTLPDDFMIHWIVIKEPNKKTKDKGSIYIWVGGTKIEDNILGHKPAKGEPRAYIIPYIIPYSIEMHKKSAAALESIKKGKFVYGKKKKGKSTADGDDEDGDGEGAKNFSINQEFEFHELLPPVMPDKY